MLVSPIGEFTTEPFVTFPYASTEYEYGLLNEIVGAVLSQETFLVTGFSFPAW